MSNVKELISEHPHAEYVLKRAGKIASKNNKQLYVCLLYTSPSPRDATLSRMPSSA